ncbi:MAG TPA: hypothetical protein VFX39_02035 [Gemmatimonadaceae bacterium]|nr:hypothetical protein [Gemmatimonadaceae bacterium]
MYYLTLSIHNVVRWLVLGAALFALFRSLSGWRGAEPWTPASAGAGRIFVILMDIQLLIGILLYAMLSPVTKQAFADFGAAMAQRELRFFAVEHLLLMVLAVAAAHMGKALAPRAATDALRWRRATLWYGLSLLLLLAGMPWWRPLLRV